VKQVVESAEKPDVLDRRPPAERHRFDVVVLDAGAGTADPAVGHVGDGAVGTSSAGAAAGCASTGAAVATRMVVTTSRRGGRSIGISSATRARSSTDL
jgi:hypothetical protein